MTTIDLNPDSPHDPDRTRELVDVLGQTVRCLNYATRSRAGGQRYPGDVYDTLGGLAHATGLLPQLLHQLGELLDNQVATGLVFLSHGTGSPAVAVAAARATLGRAVGEATALATALGHAQTAINALTYDDNDRSHDGEGEA